MVRYLHVFSSIVEPGLILLTALPDGQLSFVTYVMFFLI